MNGMEEFHSVFVDDSSNFRPQGIINFQNAAVDFHDCLRKVHTLPLLLRPLLKLCRSQALKIGERIFFSNGVDLDVKNQWPLDVLRGSVVELVEPVERSFNDGRLIIFEGNFAFLALLLTY